MAEKTDEKKVTVDSSKAGLRVVRKPVRKVVKTASTLVEKVEGEVEIKKGIVSPMETSSKNEKLKMTLMSIVVVILGLLSGYGISQVTAGSRVTTESFEEIAGKDLVVGNVVGSTNEEIFSDEVEGVLVKGGIDGEGSHHLLRPGGESQIVYMTSTVLDLDKFIDHRVKIWGETFDAQKAGWLMDAGRVELLELNAEKPFEEEE